MSVVFAEFKIQVVHPDGMYEADAAIDRLSERLEDINAEGLLEATARQIQSDLAADGVTVTVKR